MKRKEIIDEIHKNNGAILSVIPFKLLTSSDRYNIIYYRNSRKELESIFSSWVKNRLGELLKDDVINDSLYLEETIAWLHDNYPEYILFYGRVEVPVGHYRTVISVSKNYTEGLRKFLRNM